MEIERERERERERRYFVVMKKDRFNLHGMMDEKLKACFSEFWI